MSIVVIGQEKASWVNKNLSNAAGVESMQRVEAPESNSLEELKMLTGTAANTGVTSVELGIFSDGAEEKPGTLLGAAVAITGVPGTSTVLTAKLASSVALTKGTFYHIGLLSQGAALHYQSDETTTQFRESTKPATVPKMESPEKWGNPRAKSPFSVWGLGSSSARTIAGRSAMVFGQTSRLAPTAGLSGRSSLALGALGKLRGSEGVTAVLAGRASTQFASLGKLAPQAAIRGSTGALFSASSSLGIQSGTEHLYYGPASEKAVEKARLEATEGCRYLNIFPGPGLANAPVVVFVHGGGWVNEQWEGINGCRTEAEKLALEGMVVFHINYRDASETVGAVPKQLEDVEEAVAYAIAQAPAFNANPRKLVLLGGSAGGHLVARATERINSSKSIVRKVVCLSGIFDLQVFMEEMESGAYREYENQTTKTGKKTGDTKNVQPLIQHLQFALQQTLNYTGTVPSWAPPIITGKSLSTTESARAEQVFYSPTRQSSLPGCQYMLFQAELDLIERNQPEAFKAKTESEGHPVTLHLVPTEGHAFSYWGHADPTAKESVKNQIVNFILEPELEGSTGLKVTTSAGLTAQAVLKGKTTLLTATTMRIRSAQSTLAGSSSARFTASAEPVLQIGVVPKAGVAVKARATITRTGGHGKPSGLPGLVIPSQKTGRTKEK